VLVDPADLESHGKIRRHTELMVLLYELKADLNAYWWPSRGFGDSLEELIAFQRAQSRKEMPYFGQDLFIKAQAKRTLTRQGVSRRPDANHRLARKEGIDRLIDKFHLDCDHGPDCWPA